MPSALISTGSPPVHSLNHPVRDMPNHYEVDPDIRGGTGSGGASARDAALALSKLPVLGRYRDGVAVALAILVIIANLATLVGMVYFFRTSCTTEYGVLPNESGHDIPPSLANLADQGGVTIISRSMVYYQANSTFTQEGLNFWNPWARTCGCAECNLASCSATIPIVVVYEQCNPWAEAFSLASGYIVYVNMAFALFFAVVLFVVPCATKTEAARPTFWDCVIFSSGQ